MSTSNVLADIGKGLKTAGAMASGVAPSKEEMQAPGAAAEEAKKQEDAQERQNPSYAEMRGLVNQMRGK